MYFQSGPPETDFLPSSTNSPQTFSVIRHWIDDCLQNHPECNENFLTKGKTSTDVKLPTRLIFVGKEAHGQLVPRLVLPEMSEPKVKFNYLTLSHSWAMTGKSIMLTITSLERFLTEGIPLEDLSPTFAMPSPSLESSVSNISGLTHCASSKTQMRIGRRKHSL